jgi:hypothetical protein
MWKRIGDLWLLWVLVSGTGCTMCCHPYYHCGPVYQDSCGQPICSTARCGSILDNCGNCNECGGFSGPQPAGQPSGEKTVRPPEKVPSSPFTAPSNAYRGPKVAPGARVAQQPMRGARRATRPQREVTLMSAEEPVVIRMQEKYVEYSGPDQAPDEVQDADPPADSSKGPSLWIAVPGDGQRR